MSDATVDQLIAELEAYIAEAGEALDSQAYLDLKGLESRVEKLTQSVDVIDPDDAEIYVPALEGVMQNLDALQQRMIQHSNDIKEQLSSLAVKRQAGAAYRKSGAMQSEAGIDARTSSISATSFAALNNGGAYHVTDSDAYEPSAEAEDDSSDTEEGSN